MFCCFPPAAAVLGLTTRRRAVPSALNGVTGAGKGSVILGVALPLTHLVPLIISFHLHLHDDVSCSEAGQGCEILSLIYSVTVEKKNYFLFVGISENSLYTAFTSQYGHKYFCIWYRLYCWTRRPSFVLQPENKSSLNWMRLAGRGPCRQTHCRSW